MVERTCSKCEVSKPETLEFFRSRGTKYRGGLRPDCRVCSAACDRAWRQRNPEAIAAYRRAHRERIRGQMREYKRRYYATPEGKAVIARCNRKWNRSKEGRAWLTRAQQSRRARKASLRADFTSEDWQLCLEWFADSCAYCGTGGEMTQDHVIPVSSGGGYVVENIIPACGSCNSRKHAAALGEWFPRQPFFSEDRMAMILTYLSRVS